MKGSASTALRKMLVADSDNIVHVIRDEDCEMARVRVNETHVMEGNYWDFHPGCHGGWHKDLAKRYGDFNRPWMMAEAIAKAIKDIGATCRIENSTYTYPHA